MHTFHRPISAYILLSRNFHIHTSHYTMVRKKCHCKEMIRFFKYKLQEEIWTINSDIFPRKHYHCIVYSYRKSEINKSRLILIFEYNMLNLTIWYHFVIFTVTTKRMITCLTIWLNIRHINLIKIFAWLLWIINCSYFILCSVL